MMSLAPLAQLGLHSPLRPPAHVKTFTPLKYRVLTDDAIEVPCPIQIRALH